MIQDNQIGQLVSLLKMFIKANDEPYIKSEPTYHELYSILKDKLETEDENIINEAINGLLTL